ncbi:MAG: dITP/XTP pyrophosphatase [Parcubacteria group bacterium Gr01-1014_3]|nr:MAG: dITP/XTP pyrophosphatase [Parcubacteria group bacterium Gr01-1014_3]
MKELIIATHNPGKIIEYQALLGADFKLYTLKDLKVQDEPEEDGKTFEENAIKKVEYYAPLFDKPVLAEDSGLEIDYLNGEPGVLSRRWLGRKCTDEELIDTALEKLKGVPFGRRGAQFRVVVAIKHTKDSKPILAEGITRGFILEKTVSKITPGFPFRSLFYVPKIGKALGEMTIAEESKIGHRHIAIEQLLPQIQKFV